MRSFLKSDDFYPGIFGQIIHIGFLCVFWVIFCLVSSGVAKADVYIYVDSEGVTHYSNVPVNNDYKLRYREGKKKRAKTRISSTRGKRRGRLGPTVDSEHYKPVIEEAAQKYGLPVNLIKAVIQVESGFRPRAVSSAGAEGLMQLMPATAQQLSVTDSFDPRQNILGGASYLRELLDLFNGDMELSLAAYNAGEGRVMRAGAIPNIPETQNYVRKVLRWYATYLREAMQITRN